MAEIVVLEYAYFAVMIDALLCLCYHFVEGCGRIDVYYLVVMIVDVIVFRHSLAMVPKRILEMQHPDHLLVPQFYSRVAKMC